MMIMPRLDVVVAGSHGDAREINNLHASWLQLLLAAAAEEEMRM
jgi:hypothetical protein